MSEAKATALALIDALYNGIDPMTSVQDAVDDARPHADAIRVLLEDGAALAAIKDVLPSRVWSWVYHEMRNAGQDEEHAMARADLVQIETERWLSNATSTVAAALRGGE